MWPLWKWKLLLNVNVHVIFILSPLIVIDVCLFISFTPSRENNGPMLHSSTVLFDVQGHQLPQNELHAKPQVKMDGLPCLKLKAQGQLGSVFWVLIYILQFRGKSAAINSNSPRKKVDTCKEINIIPTRREQLIKSHCTFYLFFFLLI